MTRGYFGIGVYHPKAEVNVGTLWRHASAFGAAFVFTVGRRYKPQSSDTSNTPLHCPLFHYVDVDDLVAHLPHGAPLIGVELHPSARELPSYGHPDRAVYMLGAEDHGIPDAVLARCHSRIVIPGAAWSLNVAVAGTIVLYDRVTKAAARTARVAA